MEITESSSQSAHLRAQDVAKQDAELAELAKLWVPMKQCRIPVTNPLQKEEKSVPPLGTPLLVQGDSNGENGETDDGTVKQPPQRNPEEVAKFMEELKQQRDRKRAQIAEATTKTQSEGS